MTLQEKIRNLLKDTLDLAEEKTAEYTRKGRVKLEIMALKKELEEKMLQLGGDVYHLVKEEKVTSVEKHNRVTHLIRQIDELEQELENWLAKAEK